MFLRSNQNRSIDKEFVLDMAQEHLILLHQKYDHYIFIVNTEQYAWIRNTFSANVQLLVNSRTILAC